MSWTVACFRGRSGRRSCDHAGMPRLSAKERAQLPDSAFASVDSRGRRRLPIHDAAHVRNALSRFSQVVFEDDDARDRARSRLLRAAMKHVIMPVGFASAQRHRSASRRKATSRSCWPTLKARPSRSGALTIATPSLLADVRRLCAPRCGPPGVARRPPRGRRFAVFERAPAALEAALAIQRDARRRLAGRATMRPRIGRIGASGAHRYRRRRPLGPRRRAHRFAAHGRRSSRPPRCARRSSSRSRGNQPQEPRRLAISAACPNWSNCSKWTRPDCPPTSRHANRRPGQ